LGYRLPVDDAGRRLNANTGPGAKEPGPRLTHGDLVTGWASIVPGLAAIPPRDPRSIAFRLFWTRGGETGFRDFSLGAGQHLIVGRHALADVVLPSDPDLSLRHLLIVPEAGHSEPTLRLVDLRAALPMFTTHDRPERSLTVEGPFAVRLGTYLFGGFRVGPGATAPPATLPEMASVEAPSAAMHKLASATVIGHGSVRRSTIITSIPRPSTLVEIADAPSSEGPAVATLIGSRDGQTARVALREEDLRRGVLVGRAEKCMDRGLKLVMSMHISRVHAVLLMDDRRTVWLYDAASTNGTYVSGTRVRSATLAEIAPFVSRSPAVLGDGIHVELGGPMS
jgi:hypothetical protein